MALNPFGYTSQQQNIYANGMNYANLRTNYSNGIGNVAFKLQSAMPGPNVATNLQAREFNQFSFIPVMRQLGQMGLIGLPQSFVDYFPSFPQAGFTPPQMYMPQNLVPVYPNTPSYPPNMIAPMAQSMPVGYYG